MNTALADEVVATLKQARARIDHAHCIRQAWGTLESGREAYDALGALARSARTSRIFDAGHEALRAILPKGWTSVAAYNDASSTAEISKLYSHAIAAVRTVIA